MRSDHEVRDYPTGKVTNRLEYPSRSRRIRLREVRKRHNALARLRLNGQIVFNRVADEISSRAQPQFFQQPTAICADRLNA